MKTFSSSEIANKNSVVDYLKGLIVSLALSFALVILFAFMLKWIAAIESYIYIGTMLIKVICVGVGALIAIKGDSRGLLKGILFGLLYISLAFLIFSFLAGSFVFDGSAVLDFVISAIAGGIIGVIKVNR